MLVAYLMLQNAWRYQINEAQMNAIVTEIKSSPPLPSKFLKMYQAVHPNHVHSSMIMEGLHTLYSAFTNSSKMYNCTCDDVLASYYHIWKFDRTNTNQFSIYFLAKGVENHLESVDCFRFFIRLEYHQFLRSSNGIQMNFPNELTEMSEEQIINFLIAKDAPTRYNPQINPDHYQKRRTLIEKLINKASEE